MTAKAIRRGPRWRRPNASNLQGENKLALASARMALAGLPQGTPDYLRAQDIAMVSENALKKDKK